VALCQARISTKPLWGFSSSNPYPTQSRAEHKVIVEKQIFQYLFSDFRGNARSLSALQSKHPAKQNMKFHPSFFAKLDPTADLRVDLQRKGFFKAVLRIRSGIRDPVPF
jgi:hypothetical protein